jgi:Holliday junction resolvase
MSKKSRSKGKRGEREARDLLCDRDWIILANTADGSECEDIIATCPKGTVRSIEVKNRKYIKMVEFKKQAMENANKKKLPWMVMAKIEGSSSWLIWMKGERLTVWHEKRKINE